MKVVLSGSTGTIGSFTLGTLLSHPSITTVLVLTRRHPGVALTSHPNSSKAQVLVLEDFTSYPPDIISEIQSADAAIWCLGTSYGDEKVDIEFPLTFIRIIKDAHCQRQQGGSKPFRYVQLSGAFTEPPPDVSKGETERKLWYFEKGRRVRGRTEAEVLKTATPASSGQEQEQDGSGFEVYMVKPGGVIPKTGLLSCLRYVVSEIVGCGIEELAVTMADLAVKGNERQKVFSSAEVMRYGRRLLGEGEG